MMREYANDLLHEMAAAQIGKRYEHVTCYLCQGSGVFAYAVSGIEVQEPCRACNGKKTIVVERE